MIAQNAFSRMVLLLTVFTLINSTCPRSKAGEVTTSFDYLFYPNASRTNRFNTQFNFQNRVVIMQYCEDSPAKVEGYYLANMAKWGWRERPSLEAARLGLGLGPNGRFRFFEKEKMGCNIIVLTNIDGFDQTLISIEITEKPSRLKEQAEVEKIARQISPIPVIQGATEGVIFSSDFGGSQTTVNYEAPYSVSHVAEYYLKHMIRLGYQKESQLQKDSPGEVTHTSVFRRDQERVLIGISSDGTGQTSVLLIISQLDSPSEGVMHSQVGLGVSA